MDLRTLRRAWLGCALLTWNAIFIFIALNAALGAYYYIKDHYAKQATNPISKRYGSKTSQLLAMYPSLTERQVDDLLRETWSRPLVWAPFTDLTEAPFKGDYVNISSNGYRIGENQGAWPPRRGSEFVVFLFGGSTTFSYGVGDGQALGSALQRELALKFKQNVKVYNFGRAYYYSTQERILWEKLLSGGYVPDLAVFVDGMNDFYFVGHELQFIPTLSESGIQLMRDLARSLPLYRAAPRLKAMFTKTAAAKKETPVPDRSDKLVDAISRYLQNKMMIEAISREVGSRALFVWQPVPNYRYDLNYHLFKDGIPRLHMFAEQGYPLMRKLVDKNPLENFAWCADIRTGCGNPCMSTRCIIHRN